MIEPQRRLLADAVRNRAFKLALDSTVPPSGQVLDLGCGTGYLSLLAVAAGAAKVIAVEAEPGLAHLAERVLRANGAAKKVQVVAAASHDIALKGSGTADVVVSETLGNHAFEEHLIENLMDARRFLKPGGTMIPRAVTVWACPVVAPRLRESVDTWDTGDDFDLTAARRVGLNNLFVRSAGPGDLLEGGEIALDQATFIRNDGRPGDEASQRKATARWTLAKATTIHGFMLWWTAELAPGVVLSTAPSAPETHWEQVFLPLMEPLAGGRKDEIILHYFSDTRWSTGCRVTWSGSVGRLPYRMDNRDGWPR